MGRIKEKQVHKLPRGIFFKKVLSVNSQGHVPFWEDCLQLGGSKCDIYKKLIAKSGP